MKILRTLQAAAICGVLSMSTAALAQTIEITVLQNGSQVYQTNATATSLSTGTQTFSDFTISNFVVTATDFPTIGSLAGSGTVTTSGGFVSGDYLTIEISYDAYTTPSPVNTLTSSQGYSDINAGGSTGSTINFSTTIGPSGTLNASGTNGPLNALTVPAGTSGAGSQTEPNDVFTPAISGGYTLTETFVWDPTTINDQLQPTGTLTAQYTAPEGGIGLMYLLLAAMTFGGGMALKHREA
ncbi:MAG: hypothetical protein ABSD13_17475 [Candidatus Korobacteraceae bacterium]|jgi:hypothetical protein